jgi:hypothetical protein
VPEWEPLSFYLEMITSVHSMALIAVFLATPIVRATVVGDRVIPVASANDFAMLSAK